MRCDAPRRYGQWLIPPCCASRPAFVNATERGKPPIEASDYAIRPEFKLQAGDIVIIKQRASAFYSTPLTACAIRARNQLS